MTGILPKLGRAPWPIFIFLLCAGIYLARALAFHSDVLTLDEQRYLDCARNIVAGYLVTDENPDFVNGPGYPLVLAPFVKFGVSLFWARAINGIWLGLACVLLYSTIRSYAGWGWALVAALWMMFQPSMMRLGPFLMSEAFMLLCVAAFLWSYCRAIRARQRVAGWIALAALAFTAMAMTRVMFGHVATATLLITSALWPFLPRFRQPLARTAMVMGMSLLMCLPYLSYTHAKTGKVWSWSTNSGELLYWITSANPGENGFWYSYDEAMTHPDLAPHHRAFFERVTRLPVLEREQAFKEKALQNLRTVPPSRLVHHWLCNLCRMSFGFPRAHVSEDLSRGVMVLFNGPLLLGLLGAVVVLVLRPASVPPEIYLVGLVAFVYLGGSTIPPALIRYSMVVTPLVWLLIAAALNANVEVRLRSDKRAFINRT